MRCRQAPGRGPTAARGAILAACFFAFGESVLAQSTDDLAARLAAGAYADRFGAAQALVASREPDVAAALRSLESRQLSARTRVALEFVRAKRSGRSLLAATPAAARPNVLLVSIDTLRADHLGCYGYGRATSPAIDALAGEGVLFENALSPSSWTLPVHMSLLTGLYPSFHKVDKAGPLGSLRLDEAIPTLPEILHRSGYTTVGFAAHGYLAPAWGFARGFDLYRTSAADARELVDRAIAWLEWDGLHARRNLGAPSFLFLHAFDVHGSSEDRRFVPAGVGAENALDHRVGVYDSQIGVVDDQLARLFAALRQAGRYDSTLIVVTSDHGEELRDHGGLGHKSTLYEEQLHVPLILRIPGAAPSEKRVAAPVSLVDVMPSVLELVAIDRPPFQQGVSLLPLLRGEDLAPRDIFADLHPRDLSAGWDFYRRAVRRSRHKLILTHHRDGRTERELFDLAKDPEERENLANDGEMAKLADGLGSAIEDFEHRAAAFRPGDSTRNRIEIDATTSERLRSLGYEK